MTTPLLVWSSTDASSAVTPLALGLPSRISVTTRNLTGGPLILVRIEFAPAKRQATLAARRLDMADAGKVFDGSTRDYRERRFITVGQLAGRMVVLVWTPRGAARRIISMRKANAKEQALYGPRLR